MKKIKLVEVASELAAGTRGASLGIGALKTASFNKKSKFFAQFPVCSVTTHNDGLLEDVQNPYAKRIVSVRKVLESTADCLTETLQEDYFPLVLGGDHSTAAGTIAGIKAKYPEARIGAAWIDAHADLHTPFTTPSGNMHGMPLAMAASIDNLESQINNPKEETLSEWSKIKLIGGEEPKIKLEDIVFFGVRDTESPEEDLMRRHNIRNFTVDEVRRRGTDDTVAEALDLLKDCDFIYVSFDVDSMDPEISSGTGTPVPHGFSVQEARELNLHFIREKKVVAWEMVEINPTLDQNNRMADTAFGILEAVVAEYNQREAEASV
jgi:arginase